MPLFRSPPLAKKLFVPLSKRTLTSRWTIIGVSVDNARSFDAFEHNSAFTARYRGWPPSSTYNARSGWRRVPDWKPTERGERKTVDRWRRSDSLWLSYVSLSFSHITHVHFPSFSLSTDTRVWIFKKDRHSLSRRELWEKINSTM